MGEIRIFITMVMALIVMSGCAADQGLVKTGNGTIRRDVFQEITPGAPPLPGYADLRIYTSLKTHKPGLYSAKDIHGTEDYKLILNIDGQAVELRGDPRKEIIERGVRPDPEAGEGIRYHFSNIVRIRPGTYRVLIAIPSNGVEVERVITLEEGSSNSLALEPVYSPVPGKRRPGFYGNTSFTEGLDGFKVNFNGKQI
jgi:hypothetical protein